MEATLSDVLPGLATRVENAGLRRELFRYAEETELQRVTVLNIFKRHGLRARKHKCKAIGGMIKVMEGQVETTEASSMRDLLIMSGCLRICHFQIAAYEVVTGIARQFEMEGEQRMLGEMLFQEKAMADSLLSLESELLAPLDSI